ncbi:MAG: RidA family protein [Syntrophobacteraceae bacterium]|nr:RidA family protein [Syntrophobacteraceae bacterium]
MELLKRENFSSGAPFEEKVGYSRAVRVGNHIFVGGTTTTNSEGVVEGEGDPYLQTRIILEKIRSAIATAGGTLSDVVRVRFYVTDISKGAEYLRAYSEFFKAIKPTITMAEVKALARPAHLVEIEADALVGAYMTSAGRR